MNLNRIEVEELRNMRGKEGLIIQGCGGDLTEWADGISGLLTEEGILLDGDEFRDISVFENEGVTCLLFHLDGVRLNMGQLAIWRIKTHENFSGKWLSDYLDYHFGRADDLEEMEEERD